MELNHPYFPHVLQVRRFRFFVKFCETDSSSFLLHLILPHFLFFFFKILRAGGMGPFCAPHPVESPLVVTCELPDSRSLYNKQIKPKNTLLLISCVRSFRFSLSSLDRVQMVYAVLRGPIYSPICRHFPTNTTSQTYSYVVPTYVINVQMCSIL